MSVTPPSLPMPQTHCAACGYPLTGLPANGRCPECGCPYDDQVQILFGWRPDLVRPISTAMVFSTLAICFSVMLWIDAGLCFLGLGTALLFGWTRPNTSVLYFVMTTLAYAAGAWAFYMVYRWLRRIAERTEINFERLGRPKLQVRLAPYGYAKCRGLGEPREFLSWLPELELDLTWKAGVGRLRIARLSPIGSVDWATIVDIAFPATADQVAALRTYIESLRQTATAERSDL